MILHTESICKNHNSVSFPENSQKSTTKIFPNYDSKSGKINGAIIAHKVNIRVNGKFLCFCKNKALASRRKAQSKFINPFK